MGMEKWIETEQYRSILELMKTNIDESNPQTTNFISLQIKTVIKLSRKQIAFRARASERPFLLLDGKS